MFKYSAPTSLTYGLRCIFHTLVVQTQTNFVSLCAFDPHDFGTRPQVVLRQFLPTKRGSGQKGQQKMNSCKTEESMSTGSSGNKGMANTISSMCLLCCFQAPPETLVPMSSSRCVISCSLSSCNQPNTRRQTEPVSMTFVTGWARLGILFVCQLFDPYNHSVFRLQRQTISSN